MSVGQIIFDQKTGYHPISQSQVNGFEQFPLTHVRPSISQIGTEHNDASSDLGPVLQNFLHS
jgi:hypothetical protein